MNSAREALYESLRREIGNTPLYEVTKIPFPRGNRVFAKREDMEPGGSHYDRVYINLYRHFEDAGKIVPGVTPLIETTSGSGGASFARLGRLLGYETLVVCPERLPSARLDAIRREGAELRLTPGYINESSQELGRILKEENRERKHNGLKPYWALNHTQGEAAEISAHSVEPAVEEAVCQAKEQFGVTFNWVIASSGNGTTVRGFGLAAKRLGIPLVVWDHLGSGLYIDKMFGEGRFYEKYGIQPGLGHASNNVWGIAYGPTRFDLPNITKAAEEGLVDYVRILTDEETRKKALAVAEHDFGRRNIERAASWDNALALLRDVEGTPVGRSSAGNVAMVLDKQWELRDSNVLTFFYDSLGRY